MGDRPENQKARPQASVAGRETRKALVTGATGYVGSRVVQELIRRGWSVRTLSRSRDRALEQPWGDHVVGAGRTAGPGQVEVFEGDAGRARDVESALNGIDAAWYLLHSMGEGFGFAEAEAEMARTFGEAAAGQGTGRIVFLGGLHPDEDELAPGEKLSEHLASRVRVGQILMDSGVPTAALQAGVVLGDGSSSFTMLRHLSERLPGAVGPRWIRHRITPISVRDAVFCLVGAADLPPEENRAFDIGGPDTMPYADMMVRYAATVGLPWRLVATAPVTTPGLAARWVSLVTPVDGRLAAPLIGSLLHDTVLGERDLEKHIGVPEGGFQGFEDAVRAAAAGLDTRRWRRVLLGTSAAVGAACVVGSALSDPRNPWYRQLDLPSWQPPGAAFPIVWSILYADIAVVSALVLADSLEEDDVPAARKDALALAANLVLNAGWCGVFFRSRRPVAATAWAGALAVSSADLVRRAWRSAPERGVALAPYAVWTGFATVLSGAVARRNPRRSGRFRRR